MNAPSLNSAPRPGDRAPRDQHPFAEFHGFRFLIAGQQMRRAAVHQKNLALGAVAHPGRSIAPDSSIPGIARKALARQLGDGDASLFSRSYRSRKTLWRQPATASGARPTSDPTVKTCPPALADNGASGEKGEARRDGIRREIMVGLSVILRSGAGTGIAVGRNRRGTATDKPGSLKAFTSICRAAMIATLIALGLLGVAVFRGDGRCSLAQQTDIVDCTSCGCYRHRRRHISRSRPW